MYGAALPDGRGSVGGTAPSAAEAVSAQILAHTFRNAYIKSPGFRMAYDAWKDALLCDRDSLTMPSFPCWWSA